jgi:hypothetical protein
MTVKELKKALRGVPDDTEVTVLLDSWEAQEAKAWGAHYNKEEDENGDIIEQFEINC